MAPGASLRFVAYSTMTVYGVLAILMGALLPALHLDLQRAAILGVVPPLGILISTVLVGPLLDRLGFRLLLSGSVLAASAALAGLALVHGFASLLISALLYGMAGGVLNTGGNALAAHLGGSGGRAQMISKVGGYFGLGALLAPALLSLLGSARQIGLFLLILAAAGLVLAVVLGLLRFPPGGRAETPLSELLGVLRHPLVWVFGLLMFFEAGIETTMLIWSGKIAQNALHTTLARADWVLTSFGLSFAIGRWGAAALLRRLSPRTLFLLVVPLALAGCAFTRFAQSYGAVFWGVFAIGIGMAPIFPIMLGFAGDCFPNETGTVFGAALTLSLFGSVLVPLLTPLLAAKNALRFVWVPALGLLPVLLLGLLVARSASNAHRTVE